MAVQHLASGVRRRAQTPSPPPMTARFALLSVLLAFSACDTAQDDDLLDGLDLTQDPAALVGTWDLSATQSSGEMGPPVVTRGSGLRFTDTYSFRADGTYEHVYGGGTVHSGRYEVRRYEFEGRPTEIPYLFLDGDSRWFGIAGDRLFFDDRPVDGDLREYARR